MYYTKKNHHLEKSIKKELCKLIKKFSEKYQTLTLWVLNSLSPSVGINKMDIKDINIIKKAFLELPNRFQYVLLNRRFSLTPEKTFDDIGEELGISKQRVKQIENEAMIFLAEVILDAKNGKRFSWKNIIPHSGKRFEQKAGVGNEKHANC